MVYTLLSLRLSGSSHCFGISHGHSAFWLSSFLWSSSHLPTDLTTHCTTITFKITIHQTQMMHVLNDVVTKLTLQQSLELWKLVVLSLGSQCILPWSPFTTSSWALAGCCCSERWWCIVSWSERWWWWISLRWWWIPDLRNLSKSELWLGRAHFGCCFTTYWGTWLEEEERT